MVTGAVLERPTAESRHRSILVADWDVQERSDITALLHSLDYSVDEAATMMQARQYIRKGSDYGLFIFSEGLAEDNGEPSAVSMQLDLFMNTKSPVLYLAEISPNLPRDSLFNTLSGSDYFAVLRKPYSIEDLVAAVRRNYRG